MRTSALFLAAALTVGLVAGFASAIDDKPISDPKAPKASAAASRGDVQIQMTSLDAMHATIRQTWEGPSASSFRRSMDVYLGDSDGSLTKSELADIQLATMWDLMNNSFSPLAMDAEHTRVSKAVVSFDHAEGGVDSALPFTSAYDLDVKAGNLSAGDSHTLVWLPPWNGTIVVTPPAGWTATAVDGSAGTMNGGALSGTLFAKVPYSVRLSPATSAPTPATPAPTNGGAPQVVQESQDEDRVGIPLMPMLAVAALALAAAAWRRR